MQITLTEKQQMERLGNLNPATALLPFKTALGTSFDKIVNDTKAQLGRWAKDMKTEGGEWSVTDKGKLKSKDGHELQMPLNNPAAILLRYGMQLSKLAKSGDMDVDASIPKVCDAWVKEHARKAVETPEPATK
jgi:hypothetical protein